MRRKPETCDCCDFETSDLEQYDNCDTTIGGGGAVIKAEFWYCKLCASTPASNAARMPCRPGYENVDVMRTVCYIGNVILAALNVKR